MNKKDIPRLEGTQRMRLESGETDEFSFDFWDDIDEQFSKFNKSARRAKARRIGRAMRVPAVLFVCVCILVACVIFLIPRGTPSEPPITDTATETESDTHLTTVPESTENSDQTSAESPSEETTGQESETETDTDAAVPSGLYDFDYSSVPEGSAAIIPADLSLISFGENYITNSTGYAPNIKELLYAELGGDGLESLSASEAPLVLIIHTHGTESYMPEGAKFYADSDEIARSKDKTQNMIAVGREFVAVLEASGIPTLHCEIMHDEESYRESYSRAADTIKKYLDEYPSIKYVFDIHRDSLMRSSGELISAVTSINGNECAQIMPVVGSGFEGWENNMVFALQLRSKLNTAYTNLCRPACLRSSTYNQDLSAISLILEIGTSGNDLPEAKEAARLTAEIITEMILGQ